MIQVKHIKKVTSFLLLIVTALLLVACGKKENVPYGSLTNETYLSVGDVTITQKELYNNLRRESQTFVSQMIEEQIFEDYKTEALSLLNEVNPDEGSLAEEVQTLFDDVVNEKIFNTKDLELIKKYPKVNFNTNIERFVNTIYLYDYHINRNQLRDDINDALNNLEDENFQPNYFKVEALRNLYVLDVQKHLYAKEKLALDVEDEDNANFVKDTDVINYYKNNVKSHYDVNVFYFYFLNLNEANAALRHISIKASSTGHYYSVPNIRFVSEYASARTEDATKKALDKANLTSYFEQSYDSWVTNNDTETGITESQFNDFYNAYSVADSTHDKLDTYIVLEKFVELYNLVNQIGEGLNATNGIVLDQVLDANTNLDDLVFQKDGTVYETAKTHEDLTKLSSSFANYIYTELSEDKPYSTLRTVGSRRYLAFKLSPDQFELNYISEEKDEDDKEKWVTIDELKDLLANEDTKEATLNQLKALDIGIVDENVTESDWNEIKDIIEGNVADWTIEVKNNKLTSSYKDNVLTKLLEDAKIEIYDPIVRIYFDRVSDAKGKNKSGNVLIKVSYKLLDEKKSFEISVDDFYDKLEKNNGLEMALDLVMNKLLLKEYNSKNHGIFKDYSKEINSKKFKEDYKELIKNFSNDGFAQAGYPSSMGRETFLLLIFGATSSEEALEIGYLVPKLREIFFENIELSLSHLDEEDYYENLYNYTQKQYDNYRGVSVHHLLVYFDLEGDGSPTSPKEYFDTLTPQQISEVKNAIVDLHALVLHTIGNKSAGDNSDAKVPLKDYQNIFANNIINKYNDAARIDLGDFSDNIYQEFKKLGLNLKFEDISSVITNSSNFPYESTTLDKVFYDRAMALHDYIQNANDNDDDVLNGGLPHFDFAGGFNVLDDLLDSNKGTLIDYLDEDGIMSDFGFHFILVDKISSKESAKYVPTQSEKDDPRYSFEKDDVEYNVYNEDEEAITLGQIKYYLVGQKENVLVPNNVQKSLDAYFAPVMKVYNSAAMKEAVFYNYIKDVEIPSAKLAEKFDALLEINELNFYNYMPLTSDLPEFSSQYDAWFELYGGWLEAFGLKN